MFEGFSSSDYTELECVGKKVLDSVIADLLCQGVLTEEVAKEYINTKFVHLRNTKWYERIFGVKSPCIKTGTDILRVQILSIPVKEQSNAH